MNETELKILKEAQQKPIVFKDLLGEHKGVINELKIRDNCVFAYGIFFGQSCWFKLNESNMTWEEWYQHEACVIVHKLSITEWIVLDDMSDNEKRDNPRAEICGGYLKVYEYKEAWKNLWETLTQNQKDAFKTLPNYDPVIFEDITGIKFY